MSIAASHGEAPSAFSPRQLVKRLVFVCCLLLVSPLIVVAWLEKKLTRSEAWFVTFSHLLALAPGFPGIHLRAAFYWAILDDCSWETHVGFGSIFTHRAAALGRRASIGAYCVIGHARIGSGVMMGSRVSIPSGKRQHFGDDRGLTATTRFDTVEVGEGTWVGEAATIMANVGEGCVVSAGAVVARDMPAHSIVGGNPARVLKSLRASAEPADAERSADI